mgnify:FL=1
MVGTSPHVPILSGSPVIELQARLSSNSINSCQVNYCQIVQIGVYLYAFKVRKDREWKNILILKIPKIVKKCIEYWGTKKFCLTFSKHLCLKFKSLICFEVSKVRVLLFPFLQKKNSKYCLANYLAFYQGNLTEKYLGFSDKLK